MWARIHLTPVLQAEEDRDQVRRYLADKAREKELLGTETKVYHNDRYGHPYTSPIPWSGIGTNICAQFRSSNICCDPGEPAEVKISVQEPCIYHRHRRQRVAYDNTNLFIHVRSADVVHELGSSSAPI